MRHLKFRAWIKKGARKTMDEISDGEMTDSFTFTDFDGDYFKPQSCYFEDMEIEQFTGLHDKYGKEIYEGDIVRCGANDFNAGKIYKVVYSLNTFVYVRDDEPGQTCYYGQHITEVIGNIHENPELLK